MKKFVVRGVGIFVIFIVMITAIAYAEEIDTGLVNYSVDEKYTIEIKNDYNKSLDVDTIVITKDKYNNVIRKKEFDKLYIDSHSTRYIYNGEYIEAEDINKIKSVEVIFGDIEEHVINTSEYILIICIAGMGLCAVMPILAIIDVM